MSGSSYGTLFKISTFGESHGAALGVVVDGVPANLPIDLDFIQFELNRRRPGQSQVTTHRAEADQVEILSGVFEGKATGTPIAMLIRNTDQRSKDYGNIAQTYRPGHADFGYQTKYDIRDYRGGGRSSGRETAARCAAGAIAKLLLKHYGIQIYAYSLEIGGIRAQSVDFTEIESNIVRTADAAAAPAMIEAVNQARLGQNSLGGIIECQILNAPAGLGEPVFDKLDAELAKAMLSLGGVKGIEFGDGFAVARSTGRDNNDQMDADGFLSNHAGGILGGISNGQTITFRLAVKPTPSISQIQKSQDINGKAVDLEIQGRHDPCLLPRLVPVTEAMAALVLADMILRHRAVKL